MADRNLEFDIFARDRASSAFKSAGDASEGLFGKLKGLAGFVAGGALAGAAISAGKAITGMLGDAVKEAAESEKIARITANAVQATGGAAHITAGQVGDLATRLSNMTAVDDELIQSGSNLLLTFKNVRNEAGKNNDIFNQATAAALDLSAAGFGSVESASVQLGKALNDPLKGITALAKSGVTFTEQQKEQIKALTESGDLLGAQKIILGEINAQVGGAAKAAADPMARLSVVTGNLKEQLGTALLPVVTRVAEFLADRLPGALASAQAFLGPLIDKVKFFAGVFVSAFNDPDVTSDGFVGVIERVAGVLRQFVDWVTSTVVPFVEANLKPILIGLAVAFGLLTAPITTVAAALIYAYTQFDGFRNVVDAVASFLTGTVVPAIGLVAGFLIEQFGNAVAWVQEIWPQISEAISHVMNVVRDVIGVVIDVVSALWRQWGDDLLGIVRTVFNFVQETIENVMQVIRGIIQTVVALINGDWGKAWDGIKNVFGGIWDQIGNILSTAAGVLKGLLSGLVSTIRDVWSNIWEWYVSFAHDRIDAFIGFFKAMPGRISDAAAGLFDGIKDAFRSAINWIIDKWNKLEFKIPGFDPPGPGPSFPGFTLGLPSVPRFHEGGIFRAAMAGGEGLALLRDREGVFTPEQMSALGAGVTVQVFVGDREITDIVDVRVQARNQGLVDAIRAGTGRV